MCIFSTIMVFIAVVLHHAKVIYQALHWCKESAHYLDTDKRLILAKAFVSSAVFHMLRTLRGYKQITAEMLGEIIRLTPQISQASTIQRLMGVEGLIRQQYYSMFNYILHLNFRFISVLRNHLKMRSMH